MKKSKPQDKLAAKRRVLIERTARALAVGEERAAQLLAVRRQQSVRLNPLVAEPANTLEVMRRLGWQGQTYGWLNDAYSIDAGTEALRDSELLAGGAAYIQNAASWLPVIALDVQPGQRILDVCAAPGGKTSHIAALTNNQAFITANDNSRARLLRLQANCRRLDAKVEQYTLFDAQNLAYKLAGQAFDRILIDAPCSGEGLMHLDSDKDFASWSVAHIRRLQQLQKKILSQAWRLLQPGGRLVYSTCTMAPEENEMVVDYGLRALDSARLEAFDVELPNRVAAVTAWNDRALNPQVQGCLRLQPSSRLEAFFVAVFVKGAAASDELGSSRETI